MPLFARLGLLHTVEVSESDKIGTSFASHSADALGIIGATTSSGDFFDVCLQHCPQELMLKLVDHHLSTRQFPSGRLVTCADEMLYSSDLLSTSSCPFLPSCESL